MWTHWTPTARQLMTSHRFLNKRIREQHEYLVKVFNDRYNKRITALRCFILTENGKFQLNRMKKYLKNIT